MPPKKSSTLTEAELRLMKILWRRGESAVGDLVAALPDDEALAYNSVLTTIRILEQKGYVDHRQEGRAFVYWPLVAEAEAGRSEISHLIGRFFGNSREQLVLSLLGDGAMTADELKRLKEAIAEAAPDEGGLCVILLPEFLLPVGRMAAEIAVNQLWQGVVVAAGLALCLRLAPRTRASHRFALWMAAFVLVAALPLAPWFMGLIAASNAPVPTLHDAASMASAAWFQLDQRWTLAVLLVWALLAGYRLVMLVAGAARARRIWKNAIPLPALSQLLTVKSSEASSLPVQLTTLSLWARRSVEICQSPDLDRPSVIGFWRPRILLPDWLIGKLTDAELRQIVLHELEHLRRFDDWTNLFLKIASALLALNPALVWMDRQLEREREMATDEAVVRRTRAPRAYAACLASVAERRMEMKLGQSVAFELAAWRRRPELAERILSLLRTRETIGPVGRTALAGALATGMLVAVVLLARAPQLVAFQAANRPELAAEAQLVPVAAVPVALQPSKAKTRGKSHPVRQAEQPAAEDALNLQPAMEPELAELQTTADEAGTSGWVVLAVFEERVTAAGQNGLRADFDQAQASVEQKATPEARHRTRAAERRLILHLLPVHQGWVALEL